MLSTPSRRSPATPPTPTRVLVVGGDDLQRTAIIDRIAGRGYAATEVRSASAALSAIVMLSPDAIVLCDAPPTFDAFEACRRLRAQAANVSIPVALLLAPDSARPVQPDCDAECVAAEPPEHLQRWLDRQLTPAAPASDWLRATLRQQVAAVPDPVHDEADTSDIAWRRLFDHLDSGVAVVEADGRIRLANAALARLCNVKSAADCVGRSVVDLLPDTATAGPPNGVRFLPAGNGPDAAAFMTVLDQGWRRTAEEALRENHDLAEQLRRSQKIGALGRLAGGVAHDFNNLLQVIGGYAEALGTDAVDLAARRRLMRRIQRATDRAASLTRQLLAFGRRQVLVPQVVDLNVTVLSLEQMLGRVIGEDVQLHSSLAPDLRRVRVDPGQIEQVVLNLALNARDAMPDGGTLEVATANFVLKGAWTHQALPVPVPAGDWVLLSVLDTGTGMDAETASHAFEPFFTTKDASRGSGLGLSMVYGIIKQSGGYTWLESALGAGTSVHVLLPAVDEDLAQPVRDEAPALAKSSALGGTVLLVEDDPEVRALFSAFLHDGGYEVVEAADGSDALETFERRAEDIDVVMTDIVMPNVSGLALVSALRRRRPDLKVLYVSGYSDHPELAGADPHVAHLTKPVTRNELLRQLALLRGVTAPEH